MKLNSPSVQRTIGALFALSPLVTGLSMAADVVVTPSAGSGFVVKDAGGAADRLRVTEAGVVSVPAVPSAAAKTIALCADVVGVLGPCAANAGFSLPFSGSADYFGTLFSVNQTGAGGAIRAAITSVGSTSDALRSQQSGLGRAISGQILNASNSVAAVRGDTNGSGYGVFGQATGSGNAGFFEIVNATSASNSVTVTTDGVGRGASVSLTNAANPSAAVYGETNGSGKGVHGHNAAGGIGVLGTSHTGPAGYFDITNPSSSDSSGVFSTTGTGKGIHVQLLNASNGSRAIDVNQSGVGPGVYATSAGGNAVWGITSAISAAGVIGDNTFGEAVVGRNRGGNGVGAVVGRNDDAGYGVRGFNTRNGIGVIGQAGISGGTGVAGRFEQVNAANASNQLESAGNGTGAVLYVVNSNAAATDLAILRKGGTNVARIDSTGKGFFN